MGRPKKKKDYDSKAEAQKLMNEVVAYFGINYDDRNPIQENGVSLRDVADHFGITLLKARRILITAGVYSTEISRRVQELYQTGKNEQEIMAITGLSRASVNSYIPYKRIVYNLPTLSVDADRKKLQKKRQLACKRFIELMPDHPNEEIEEALWKLIEFHQGCVFYTTKGLRFRYKVKDDKIMVTGIKSGISKVSLIEAWWNLVELEGMVKKPKMLGVRGCEYLYPVFERFGVIFSDDK